MHHLSIPEAIAEIRDGKFIIVVDDEGRENEGDLVMAAQCVTPEAVNFMTRYGRGLICVPTTGERLDALELPLMVPQSENSSGFGTAFTVSVEARSGVTTGISAYDRARTIQTLADPSSTSGDLSRPGHVFPLRAHPDGVLGRPGQTEASVDLVRLAGLNPVAVICEIIDEDGTMARMPLVERPEAVLAEADHDLIERLERKVTPPLLAIAGVGTFLVLWGWGGRGASLGHRMAAHALHPCRVHGRPRRTDFRAAADMDTNNGGRSVPPRAGGISEQRAVRPVASSRRRADRYRNCGTYCPTPAGGA